MRAFHCVTYVKRYRKVRARKHINIHKHTQQAYIRIPIKLSSFAAYDRHTRKHTNIHKHSQQAYLRTPTYKTKQYHRSQQTYLHNENRTTLNRRAQGCRTRWHHHAT